MSGGGPPDRLIEWTGERCVPWAADVQVVYEHLHRYLLVAPLARGASVLDLGCGEGYGADLLAEHAARVVGLDLDEATVEHARRAYARPNLEFAVGSALALDGHEDGTYDLVVCFELLEHVAEQERLLDEARRVLAPGGVLALSTPNRPVYAAEGYDNPFHVRELDAAELERLLRARFRELGLWVQSPAAGSVIEALAGGGDGGVVRVRRVGDRWRETAERVERYLVALACDGPLPELPSGSVLLDERLEVVAAARAGAEERARALAAELDRTREELDRTRGELGAQIDVLEEQAERGRELEAYLAVLSRTKGHRALEAYWSFRQALRERRPPPVRRRERAAAPEATGDEPPARPAAVRPGGAPEMPPRRTAPAVSVVVAAHENLDLTLRCLGALARHTDPERTEVIVVDDASGPATADALARVPGIRLLRNETNLGFLRSSNAGAAAARGEYLAFLNNDTEVQPGWLEHLLDAARSAPDVGAVGSKLVYPDGRLQEAGAVVWTDATGWNVGRGRDPEAFELNHRREVDYCSAAALLVRRELFERLGGFDERFAPGYYEDTDLCFALADAGYRTLYEPRAVVVHHEGATHGTDERPGIVAGGKAHQYVNRRRFQVKWAARLARQLPPGTGDGLLGGGPLAGTLRERPRVLVADTWVPAHDRDSGSLRMTWSLRLLRELGCDVTLYPLNLERREPYTAELQRLGVEVVYGPHPFAPLAGRRSGLYDLVLLSRPNVADALLDDVRRAFPRALLVYDTVDLHFLRETRRQEVVGGVEPRELAVLRRVELGCIRRADLVATVTEAEAATVRRHVPSVATVVLPNVHEVDAAPPLPFAERRDLVFIGGFQHDPNVDAVRWFVDEVQPLLRGRVDARLWVLGADPPPEIRALAGDDVVVTGYLPSVDEVFRRARVFVSPLRYGAGMKGKNGQALAFGLPLVTTAVGAEGMDLVDGRDALVRDGAAAFAEAVARVYGDEELWTRLSARGRELVAERWSPAAMRGRLERLVREACPGAVTRAAS